MGPPFYVYPDNLLAELKKGEKLKKELADEIMRVLQTDPDVKELLRSKTMAKYQELVRRSRG
jgi:hypothetical protein